MCKRSTAAAAAAVDHKLGFDTVFSMANIMYLLKESKVYKNGPTFGYLIFSFFPIVAAKEDIVVWLKKEKSNSVCLWPFGLLGTQSRKKRVSLHCPSLKVQTLGHLLFFFFLHGELRRGRDGPTPNGGPPVARRAPTIPYRKGSCQRFSTFIDLKADM